MIKKLKQEDQKMVLDYLYQDVSYNIFPIGDIEAFGMETDFQRVYGEFNEKGDLLSILLRYKENAIYTSHLQHFNQAYLDILKLDPSEFISGKAELMALIDPFLDGYTKKEMFFCMADHMKKTYEPSLEIKRLETKEDIIKLFDLLKTIDEFSYLKRTKEAFLESYMKTLKMGINYIIEEDDIIVASVATTAETSKNAMVVAVATLENHRHKGYASALLLKLMHTYIIDKKKALCLFYNNPEAGKIYMRLGFEPIGKWTMYQNI